VITTAILNEKGGTGKTTTAITLASGLAYKGYSVLLIDLDPQANATEYLGIRQQPGLFNVLGADQPITDHVIATGTPRLRLLPNERRTGKRVKAILTAETGKPAIAQVLAPLRNRIDFVILDCPPSPGIINDAALWAAQWVLSPFIPEHGPVSGLRSLSQAIIQAQDDGRPVQLLGVIPTLLDVRKGEHKANLARVHRAYGNLVYPTVRNRAIIAELPATGSTLWALRPTQPHKQRARAIAVQEYGAVLGRFLTDVRG